MIKKKQDQRHDHSCSKFNFSCPPPQPDDRPLQQNKHLNVFNLNFLIVSILPLYRFTQAQDQFYLLIEENTNHTRERSLMSEHFLLLCFFILFSGKLVAGDYSLDTDKQVLLSLKSYLENQTVANKGGYINWNKNSSNPCEWSGISCSLFNGTTWRVVRVEISASEIAGTIFQNFSHLTELTHLDLSWNSLSGVIPEDLNRCQKLVFLNLSRNILEGELNLSGLKRLQTLDLSVNRIHGWIGLSFPDMCDSLVTLNVSQNHFTGRIDECFEECLKLQYLDLSSNNLSGGLWSGISRLKEFSVSENNLRGVVAVPSFPGNCSLVKLDLSVNGFVGEAPKEVANCKNLEILNLSNNIFTGDVPEEIGSISGLLSLFLQNNSFSREIPETLLSLTNLFILDLSRNKFGGEIQEIFGKFKQVKFLLLHSNSYTGGLNTSGIFSLTNLSRLDLSFNNFSGPLPAEISQMSSLTFLTLTYNQFSGPIPSELGKLTHLLALDLANNSFSGPIPPSLGNLSSLLWLMLANNSLTGEIPPELGNCSSMLWLNLANNKLSGKFPSELTKIGRNSLATFESNRRRIGRVSGNSECLSMRRWIPADYPPFSFVYSILTRRNCRAIWDRLLKGYGVFPVCTSEYSSRSSHISGYVQLRGNQLSGEIPPEIGTMMNFSILDLGDNMFSGKFPQEMVSLPLVVLNMTRNNFSGEIPMKIGNMKCLQNLDLSWNNFSGTFPSSLVNLDELSRFNISYNPFISGVVPPSGHLLTFDSYLGNPLLNLPTFIDNTPDERNRTFHKHLKNKSTTGPFCVALTLSILFFGLLLTTVCFLLKRKSAEPGFDKSQGHEDSSSTGGTGSSPWMSDTVKIFHLNNTIFTHADILEATGNFTEKRIIGKGGFGTVYRGIFPDGREVAVKKLQREGIEGEKEFRAEMQVLSGHGFSWPHPNLVTLHGWCLYGSQKILVYEYIGGGSLEDVVTDTAKFTWRRRIEVAIDVARALVYLHHECYPSIVHRDVKASNVLLEKDGKAKVTDFGLARVVDAGDSHVSTMVAGTVGYVAPEYGQTWQATTKGDVYSFGVLAMELATGRRAVDGGEECLVERVRRVTGSGRHGLNLSPSRLVGGAKEMGKLLQVGLKCTHDTPQARSNMKEVLAMLIKIYNNHNGDSNYEHLV
ncbi:probable LRR receptor-like serine/threonine-protein kinase At1g74360 [Lotus japonicus]|uniref:probable LRR receptor-like serine/threonine-protein kinase At1g74360 n=1 Tax=Lotus japonicus TaxID=34305 RepID=UPI002588BC6B|nr:probable LRR receptor-like serine/threonine-protein kinase At1g74360 [Lotus japonicus]